MTQNSDARIPVRGFRPPRPADRPILSEDPGEFEFTHPVNILRSMGQAIEDCRSQVPESERAQEVFAETLNAYRAGAKPVHRKLVARIERGDKTVAMGMYLAALDLCGMSSRLMLAFVGNPAQFPATKPKCHRLRRRAPDPRPILAQNPEHDLTHPRVLLLLLGGEIARFRSSLPEEHRKQEGFARLLNDYREREQPVNRKLVARMEDGDPSVAAGMYISALHLAGHGKRLVRAFAGGAMDLPDVADRIYLGNLYDRIVSMPVEHSA